MSKDKDTLKLKNAHCPYCSNKCPLDKPKCHKGKDLAKALEEKNKTATKVKQNEKSAFVTADQTTDEGVLLTQLYDLLELSVGKVDKAVNDKAVKDKAVKDKAPILLKAIAEQGTTTQEAIGKTVEMKEKEMKKYLSIMKKKRWILAYKEKKEVKMVLSKEGKKQLDQLSKVPKEGKKQLERLKKLTREEQESLAFLLKKITGDRI